MVSSSPAITAYQLGQYVLSLVAVVCFAELVYGLFGQSNNHHGPYTDGGNVWCNIAKYIVKWTQEKWACDSHDGATPLSFPLQVTEDFF